MSLASIDPARDPDAILRDDSPWREGRLGLALIFLFFGVFGLWAALAPLDAAVVASGEIKVAGNRQVVQHRDGGVVSSIFVHEGDRVRAGQILMELSGVEIAARERALQGQALELEASRERLMAETSGAKTVARPAAWASLPPEYASLADAVLKRQQGELEARAASMDAQVSVLVQRQREGAARIEGYHKQIAAIDTQSNLVDQEVQGLKSLSEEGYAAPTRVRGAERTAAELVGQRAEMLAQVEQAREGIGEARLQSLSLREDRARQAAEELRQADTQLADIAPQLQATRVQLERTRVRAPTSGVIVGLGPFNVGAVVGPGEKILELVPDDQSMVMEVRVRPMDADEIHPGQATQVHLSAFQGRQIPRARGVVERISADRFEDPRTGARYFVADIKVEQAEIRRIEKAAGRGFAPISPGLPVEVVIPLHKRTALQYLLEPLGHTLWRSFREN